MPIDLRQMRPEIAGRNIIDDLYRVRRRRRVGLMQKSRRDEEEQREQREMAERGDNNRRGVPGPRQCRAFVTVRRCHVRPHFANAAGGRRGWPRPASPWPLPRFPFPPPLTPPLGGTPPPTAPCSLGRLKTMRPVPSSRT